MANRPLYNGTARLGVDNNVAEPLLNRFTFRVKVGAAPDPANENIDNTTFQAKAGVAVTIHYDIRKFGSGAEADTPTEAFIRIFGEGLANVASSPDLVAGGALPRTGTFVFTPANSGTFWVLLEMRRIIAGVTQWAADNNDLAVFVAGTMTRRFTADKGRLRAGVGVNALTITERGNPIVDPFAVRMNAAQTATEESVRYNVTMSHDPQVQRALAVRNRRNGLITLDAVAAPSPSTAAFTQDFKVNQLNYPTLASQLYDAVLFISEASLIHTGNTPQYSGLGDPASASGAWTHFTDVGAGLTLESFQSVARLASHTVNSLVTIDNTFADFSDEYTEDANGFPTGTENIEYVATDKNMTVKVVGVKNARGEPLGGIFVTINVVHEASGAVRDTWGIDNSTYRTNALGHQSAPKVVTVSTPPGGLHKIDASAYFPSGSFSVPASRELLATRIEQGSPGVPAADASKGKNWIPPASFFVANVVVAPVVKAGQLVNFIIHIFNKIPEIDADVIPVCKVYKSLAGDEAPPFDVPVLTKRAGTTGIYDGSFTPSTLANPAVPEIYEVAVGATVISFTKVYSAAVMAVELNNHEGLQLHKHPASLIGMPGPPVL